METARVYAFEGELCEVGADSGPSYGNWLARKDRKRRQAAHMHYTILTPVPHFRLYDKVYGNGRQPEKFNWQKMFYLNPDEYLRSK